MTYEDEQRAQHEHELDQLEGKRIHEAIAHTDRENANLHSTVKRLEKENKELRAALEDALKFIHPLSSYMGKEGATEKKINAALAGREK